MNTTASLSRAMKNLGYTKYVAPKARRDARGNLLQSCAIIRGYKVVNRYNGDLDVELYDLDKAEVEAKLTGAGYVVTRNDEYARLTVAA
jgi:hypothetical protein